MSFPWVSTIVLNPDGTEDGNLRCIQANRVAAQMKEELSPGTVLLTQDKDNNDPFVDYEDDEELETNETLIDDDTDQLTTLYTY